MSMGFPRQKYCNGLAFSSPGDLPDPGIELKSAGKTIVLTIWIFVSKVMSLLFNMWSRFVTAFLPRSKYFISWLQSPSTVILEPKKITYVTTSTFSSSIYHDGWWDLMPWSYIFDCWVLSQLFHSPLSPSSRGSLVPLYSLPSAESGIICISEVADISPCNLDSNLWVIPLSIPRDVLCIQVK